MYCAKDFFDIMFHLKSYDIFEIELSRRYVMCMCVYFQGEQDFESYEPCPCPMK